MNVSDLKPNEYHSNYAPYIAQVPEGNLIDVLNAQKDSIHDFYQNIPDDKLNYSYAAGKWTIMEVIQHLLDAERVFSYRALRFSRADQTPIHGFEQDDYIVPSKASSRSIANVLVEFNAQRTSTIELFKSFDNEMQQLFGTASGVLMSVRACGFIIAGHELHHAQIIRERYL